MADPILFDNERSSFEAIALPYSKSIYNAALRLTRRHPEDAADLGQETFLRAYRTYSNFIPGTNCKAWLFTIMYSIFANRYRKEQRHPEPISIDASDEIFRLAAASDLPNMNEIGLEVNQALDRLPEAFRSALIMVDVEELSYEEAAAVLNCPVGTVRSRLFRARRLLFTELQSYARQNGYALKSHAFE